MSAPSSVATKLARMVHLLRVSPEAREEQKAAFLDLNAELSDTGLRFSADQGGVSVGGVPLPAGSPGLGELQDAMFKCGVWEIRIPPRVHPALLLSLLRALASPTHLGSLEDLVDQFDPAGTGEIQVLGSRPMPRSSGVIALEDPGTAEPGSPDIEPRTIELPDDGDEVQLPGLMRPTPGAEEYMIGPIQEDSREGTLLHDVEPRVKAATERGDWQEFLSLMTQLFDEQKRETNRRLKERYITVLRRVLPRSVQESLARYVAVGEGKAEAVALFNRLGAEPAEVLLELLAAAPTLAERRAYFSMLSHMREGKRGIINRLDHPEWFVVRNIAELCGELRITDAVPRLAHQVEHEDERVRRAVAAALGKIGTPAVAQPLRKALWDQSTMVRLDAVQAIDRETGRGLAMTLSLRLDDEQHPDVQRELYLALGRIGTPDAVQTLVRAAQPKRSVFSRRRTTTRVAAVAGLGEAGGSVAIGTLQELLTDNDRAVQEAARTALAKVESTP